MVLPPPLDVAGGADPIVNNEPPTGWRVEGDAWKGEVVCGAEALDWPNAKPPGVVSAWGKLVLALVAGEVG